MKKQSLTIGICTSFASEQLVHTARSISDSSDKVNCRKVIYADNTAIPADIMRDLKTLGFTVIWRSGPGSFFQKASRLVADTHTDLLILTQDDVIFDSTTIPAILNAFNQNPAVTMLGVRILPLKPVSFFERATASMIRMVDTIAGLWNGGDNYLAASGRCLAFRTTMIKNIPLKELVNGDMYLYIANQKKGGQFVREKNAIVYIRAPQNLHDQSAPSSRFQYSQLEMEHYFNENLDKLYNIPILPMIIAVLRELCTNPIGVMSYIFVFIHTRVHRIPQKKIMRTIWTADISTKRIR